MAERVVVRSGAYHDSVTLMLASRAAGAVDGVEAAAVIMATPLNLELLGRQAFGLANVNGVGPNDLLIAVRARDESALAAGMDALEVGLAAPTGRRDIGGSGAVGPMAGVVSTSVPMLVVENATHANRACCTFNEGLGKVLRYGANDAEVLERLSWMRTCWRRSSRSRSPACATRSICGR